MTNMGNGGQVVAQEMPWDDIRPGGPAVLMQKLGDILDSAQGVGLTIAVIGSIFLLVSYFFNRNRGGGDDLSQQAVIGGIVVMALSVIGGIFKALIG